MRRGDPQNAAAVQLHPGGQRTVLTELVQVAAHLTRIAAKFAQILLERVDFFDDVNGNDDVVVFEEKHGARIMQQHVGVEDEDFLVDARDGRPLARSPLAWPLGAGFGGLATGLAGGPAG